MSRADLMRYAGMDLGWLVVVRSEEKDRIGSVIQLTGAVTGLTRGDGATAADVVSFRDEYMSSAHASIHRPLLGDPNPAFTVKDRSDPPSANGTFVNAQRVPNSRGTPLCDGDVILVGSTELVFKSLRLPGGQGT